jgi:hypothetical protein
MVHTDCLTFRSATQNQRTSPFLHLPAELRNRIYAFALGHRTAEVSGCVFPPNPKDRADLKEEEKLSLLFAPWDSNRSTYVPITQPHAFALLRIRSRYNRPRGTLGLPIKTPF